MSSPPPPPGQGPPPPPPGQGGPPPPPPPPSGSPGPGYPPPLPPPPPDPSSSNYFFGFVITFIVLLLLFIGCGIGSWRRFRIVGTTWDGSLQYVEDSSVGRKRRRHVRPVFLEMWTRTKPLQHHTDAPTTMSGGRGKWDGLQPISAAFIWSRSALRGASSRRRARPPSSSTPSSSSSRPTHPPDGAVIRGVGDMLGSVIFPCRTRHDVPPGPPPARPSPEAIQVAVMIAMPSPPSCSKAETKTDEPQYVGHAKVGEYQIGVVRIPWPSPVGDGT